MKKTRILAALLAGMTILGTVACGSADDSADAYISASSSAEKYVEFLKTRLGDDVDGTITLALADKSGEYGVDLDGFRDEGYVIKKESGNAVIVGKTEDGLDRAVRYYANNMADVYAGSYAYGESAPVKSLTIAGHDISEYTIVQPKDADECHRYAAESLQKYIKQACGAELAITDTADGALHTITLHQVTESEDDFETLGEDGFTFIVDEAGNLTIRGGYYRGCMYGVFTFLEEYVGYRFLYDFENAASYTNRDDGMIDYVFEADHIDIPAGLRDTTVPSFIYRDNFNRSGAYGCQEYGIKSRNSGSSIRRSSKYNGYGYGAITAACHGLQNQALYSQFEDFNISDSTQPCFTDPDVIEISKNFFISQTRARIDAGEKVGREIITVDVAQMDFMNFCMCRSCQRAMQLDGGYIGPVLTFTNTMAEALEEEFGEGVYASMLVYWGTTSVPKVTRPRHNVNASYCFYNDIGKNVCYNHCIDGLSCDGITGHGGTIVSNKQYGEELRGWVEIADMVTVWYYPGYWYWGSMISPTYETIREDLKFLSSYDNIYGIYNCVASYDMPDEKIIPYLLSHLAWDADMSDEEYEKLICDYYRAMGGEGYEYIYEYMTQSLNTYARGNCWSIMYWTNPSVRIDFDRVREGFRYDVELFERAIALAGSTAEQEFLERLSLSMYFTGLVASHTDWYLEGNDESRALYEEYYNRFMERGVKYKYPFDSSYGSTTVNVATMKDKFSIEKNPAELYRDSEKYLEEGSELTPWWPTPDRKA